MKHRLLFLILIPALLLSLTAPALAAGPGLEALARSALTKRGPMGDCYVYPYATSFDASVCMGETALLQFKRSRPTPGSDDRFFVEIYPGAVAELSKYALLPKPVEQRSYPMSDFNPPSYALGVSWKADSRYSVGDYTLVCGVVSAEGEVYDQDCYAMDLHVVSGAIPAASLAFYLGTDGTFEVRPVEIGVGETAVVMPGVLPVDATSERSCTAYSAQAGVATVSMEAGYLHIKGVAAGKTDIVVRCGKLEARCPVTVGRVHSLRAAATRSDLCVGMTDAIQIEADAASTPVFLEYSSDHPEVAEVKNGVVTAVAPGRATVTVSAWGLSASVEYTVRYHDLPADTPRSVRTATQPAQSVGPCGRCGNAHAVNVYEPAVFADTVWDAWYAEHVDYVYEQGLMNGTGEHSFSPDSTVTRAMVVTVLHRMQGAPKPEGESGFTDVPAGQWYTDAVAWARAEGIITGYPDGSCRPGSSITREQLATILYRYTAACGETPVSGAELSGFPDAGQVQGYALEGMRWAIAAGLINGVASGGKSFLRPGSNATRAQFATIISRFVQTAAPHPAG